MNNKRATKRALLTSVMALVMCVVMLVGTTFAWFTDTASTGVNKIVAGNLDVALEMKNPDYNSTDSASKEWISAEGKTLQFKKAAGAPANEQVLWEPGCRYELPQLRVVNNGNLALKYKIQITGIQGSAKLNEVIDWTINDAPINLTEQHLSAGQTGAAFTIKGVMQTTAGNEYQGLSIDGIGITVYATQDNVENDSFGPDYDKYATYYPVLDAAGMKDALVNGGNIKVDANVDVGADALVVAKNTTIDANGKTLTTTADIWDESKMDWSLISARNGANLTITGNGTFKAKENDSFAVDVQDGSIVTIENGTFIGNMHAVYVYDGTAVIEGGFFDIQQKSNIAGKEYEFVLNCYDANRDAGSARIIVKGGTFVNFNPADCKAEGEHTNFVADGYSVITETKANGDKWYTVVEGTAVEEATNEAFAAAVGSVASGGTVVLPAGEYTIPTSAGNKEFTISGTKDTVVKIDTVNTNAGGADVTFKGVTINGQESGDYAGLGNGCNVSFVDCTINGKISLYGEKASFVNCTFNNKNDYSVWTWGGKDVDFIGCTFNSGGKALLVYGEYVQTNIDIIDCTFNDDGTLNTDKAAIEIGSDRATDTHNINIKNITVNGFAAGKNTGSTTWANKNSMPTDRLNVVIDGVVVY